MYALGGNELNVSATTQPMIAFSLTGSLNWFIVFQVLAGRIGNKISTPHPGHARQRALERR
jgi:hypothetical protein